MNLVISLGIGSPTGNSCNAIKHSTTLNIVAFGLVTSSSFLSVSDVSSPKGLIA